MEGDSSVAAPVAPGVDWSALSAGIWADVTSHLMFSEVAALVAAIPEAAEALPPREAKELRLRPDNGFLVCLECKRRLIEVADIIRDDMQPPLMDPGCHWGMTLDNKHCHDTYDDMAREVIDITVRNAIDQLEPRRTEPGQCFICVNPCLDEGWQHSVREYFHLFETAQQAAQEDDDEYYERTGYIGYSVTEPETFVCFRCGDMECGGDNDCLRNVNVEDRRNKWVAVEFALLAESRRTALPGIPKQKHRKNRRDPKPPCECPACDGTPFARDYCRRVCWRLGNKEWETDITHRLRSEFTWKNSASWSLWNDVPDADASL